MSQLVLCKNSIAAMPYYMENISLNVYSLEEVCYFIKMNTDLAEEAVMNLDFCSWIEQEMQDPILAQRLAQMVQKKNILLFMQTLLNACGYLNPSEIEQICITLQEFADKSEIECRKIRADRLVENQKFAAAVQEYGNILAMEECREENALTIGALWNNLGTSYASIFLYEKAAECFKRAYSYNLSQDVKWQYWRAMYFIHSPREIQIQMYQQNIDEVTYHQFMEEMKQLEQKPEVVAFDAQLEKIDQFRRNGELSEYDSEIEKILQEWKTEYSRNCMF